MDSVGEGEGGKIWENGIETLLFFLKRYQLKGLDIFKILLII